MLTLGPEFSAQVRKFKKMNALLQPLIRLKWALVPATRWYEPRTESTIEE